MAAPVNRLQEIWAAGRPAVNGWLILPDMLSAEVMARAGFDSVTVDMQHGTADHADMLRMVGAIAGGGAVPIVRVPWNEPGAVMRALDAGALGIICPMIEDAAQCAAFVRNCLYAPQGGRSIGIFRARLLWGEGYAAAANSIVLPLAMIETVKGLDNLEAIVATPGLGGIYIGPSDLSTSMGFGPGLDRQEPEVLAAIDRILAAAAARNLPVGIQCTSPAYAAGMARRGMRLLTVGTDAGFIDQGARAAIRAFHDG